jgi:hypothetical protein
MNLAEWQSKLEDHFGRLRQDRTKTAGQSPIFALEHGLTVAQIEELADSIKSQVAGSAPSRAHYLAWVVYATEIGYQYSGDEYWQTFEDRTPGWDRYGLDSRRWLREYFQKFHEMFGGAKPSGAWAEHFSIICWPITNAVVPKDLQRQFARVLYDIRSEFSPELLQSTKALGDRIAAASWSTTTRFQKLVEEPLLVGQIAAALLMEGGGRTQSLVLPLTLQRIAGDVDHERTARDWLRTAQKLAQRIQIRGVSGDRQPTPQSERVSREHGREQIASLGLEPAVRLQPNGPIVWDVLLDLPDFSPLLGRFPWLQKAVTESTCVVAGSSGRPLARGRLLHGSQSTLLKTWPRPTEPLLRFEPPQEDLSFLLRTDCLLRPGELWLFKVAADGIAYELRRKVVRPRKKYILLSSKRLAQVPSSVRRVQLSCEGIDALEMEIPSVLSVEWLRFLQSLELESAKSITVCPAGLTALDWDGEGHAAWLSTEEPCLAISSDHPIGRITIKLEGGSGEALTVRPESAIEPVFVQLPKLRAGAHKLHLEVEPRDSSEALVTGLLDIVIRDPLPWRPGMSDRSPMTVVLDPPSPSLEELWANKVRIEVRGPAGREVECTARLFNGRKDVALVEKALPRIALPIDSSGWRAYFTQHFKNVGDVSRAFDDARISSVRFSAGELGTFTLTCEREFAPLRWIYRERRQRKTLRLVDDSGANLPSVFLYEFNSPEKSKSIDPIPMLKGDFSPTEGGLYLAQSGIHSFGFIVPPIGQSLLDLRVAPRIHNIAGGNARISELLFLYDLWAHAHLPGDLFATSAQRDVLKVIIRQIFAILCGRTWEREELSLEHTSERSVDQLQAEIGSTVNVRNWAAELAERANEIAVLPTHERAVFFSESLQDHLEYRLNPIAISIFALKLASWPEGLRGPDQSNFQALIEELTRMPNLARGARFLVLAVDRLLQAKTLVGGRPYSGWEWE